MAHLTTDPSCQQRWVVLYPSYINSRKTQEEGRKIGKAKAVDNPKISEIKDVLSYHNFNCQSEENKQYPRDSFKDAFCRGRVRVQLKNSDGTAFNEKYPTRKAIMLLLGEMIPKLKGRQVKGAAAADSGGQAASSNKKSKKKNR